ncbi:MAG: DUF4153 domain-containing protein [Bacteroidia bacterium]
MIVKIPTINHIYSSVWGVFKRFPLALLTVFLAAGVAIYLTENEFSNNFNFDTWLKLLLTASLALPFFIAVSFISESTDFDNGRKMVFHIVAFIIVFLYYWHFDNKLSTIDYIRTFVLNIAVHLFVSFSPFLKTYNENGFWQFNKTLFLRYLLSILYTGILYGGLSVALLAIDNLFDVKINEKIYVHLWIVMAIIFNTIFFLAGIPQNLRELHNDYAYPKGLKVFTQFVLLPLVSVYLFILYVYGFKILVSWQLPHGWVSYLVMCFSVAGIFSLLMIHPIKDTEQNKWMNIYSRWYYRLLFPLLILLAIAIYVRVKNYGITENRYFLIALAIWLFITVVYFIFSKKKTIQWIPISLSIVAILSVFGPWSAFAVSEKSQVERLEKLLIQNNILQNGKINPAKDTIPFQDEVQIASIIRYLDETHGYKKIQPWFEKNLDTLFKEQDSIQQYLYKPEIVLKEMGLQNNYGWREEERYNQTNFSYNVSHQASINISGYDEIITINTYENNNKEENVFINLISDTLLFGFNTNNDYYSIKNLKGEKIAEFGINEFAKQIHEMSKNNKGQTNFIDPKYMYHHIPSEGYKTTLFIRYIYGDIQNDSIKTKGFEAYLLIAYPKNVR